MITYVLITWCLCGSANATDPEIDPMTQVQCEVRREITLATGQWDGAQCVLAKRKEAGS